MLIKAQEREATHTPKPKDGTGEMTGFNYLKKGTIPPKSRFAMVAVNTLTPGSKLGFHVHSENEEIFLILEGQGVYTDHNKTDQPVDQGDLILTYQGQGHALTNTGTKPLVFAAVIADDGQK